MAGSEIQECAQNAPHGEQFIGCDSAKAVVEALICHRPHVFGPGEGGKLAQARRWRSDRNLVTKAPVPARDGYHEDDRMRQGQMPRSGNDDDRPPASLLRSDDRIKVSQPYIARPQRLVILEVYRSQRSRFVLERDALNDVSAACVHFHKPLPRERG